MRRFCHLAVLASILSLCACKENKGIDVIELQALRGNASAQYALGVIYEERKDYIKALDWYTKSAERGNPDAQSSLGKLYFIGVACNYFVGTSCPNDGAKAFELFMKSAEQGNFEAKHNLGFMLSRGIGVRKNNVEAYKWYSLAINEGAQISIPFLDSLAKEMTPEQIAEAQRLAREWKPSTPPAQR